MGSVSPRAARIRSAVAGLLFSAALASGGPATAQVCDGALPLLSPSDLTVSFENQATLGTRLRWNGVPRESATCVRLDIGAGLQNRLDARWQGVYSNLYDRSFTFAFSGGGTVGDRTRDDVLLTVNNAHPNAAAGNLIGRINLSGRGGIFRVDPDGVGDAEQYNEGLPAHLDRTEVVALALHGPSGAIVAGIDRLPVVISDTGGTSWFEPVVPGRPPFLATLRNIAVSPNDGNLLLTNPDKAGLWRSIDRGVTWQRDTGVDALAGTIQTVDVSFMKYLRVVPEGGDPGDPNDRVNRLYLHVVNVGLFFSDDDGLTFRRVRGLERPVVDINPVTGLATINCGLTDSLRLRDFPVRDIVVSPTFPEKIYVGVDKWGVHLGDTASGHRIWEQRNNGIVACQGNAERLLGERRAAERIVALPGNGDDILVVLTDQPAPPAGTAADERSNTNMFLSQDGGRSWSFAPLRTVLDPLVGEETLRVTGLVRDPRPARPRGVIAGTADQGLWAINIESQEGVWVKLDQQPSNPKIRSLLPLPSGQLLVGTGGAGVYRPGLQVSLDRLVSLSVPTGPLPQVGLEVSFHGAGEMFADERFTLLGQTFQAYAVWRARELDPVTGEPDWTLVGLYDRTNPEFCSPNACDEPDLVRITGCFADKRANCFAPPPVTQDAGPWEFFDRDVYNGFTYFYAVTTLDYGNTATISPTNFNGDFTFSPRSAAESDPAALPYVELNGGANFNQVRFQVNLDVAANLDDVFVVPNPLVRQAGWDVGGESSVRFVNVTPTARVEIFTLAGDLVRRLENVVFDGAERGNIEWDTRNGEGEQVASGVYIYRVTDDDGNEVVSRFTVIR